MNNDNDHTVSWNKKYCNSAVVWVSKLLQREDY